MPVYNASAFLPAAIQGILHQSFTDFEFLIINDGSTDQSVAAIEKFSDSRIRLLHNVSNLGVVATLNRGLELARGEYVARMDADDICMPERLQRQVEFMDANLEVGVCGSWLEAFDGTATTLWSPPTEDEEIKASLLFESVIYHPTVMMRMNVLSASATRYDETYPHAEDYELWSRISGSCRFANIGAVLLQYRLHDQSVGRRKADMQSESAGRVRRRFLCGLGIEPSEAEFEVHDAISTWRIEEDLHFLERAHCWLLKVHQSNEKHGLVARQALNKALSRRWYEICFLSTALGMDSYRFYFQSPLSAFLTVSFRHKMYFWLRALLGRK